MELTREENFYKLITECADILSSIDILEKQDVYKHKMKMHAKGLKNECETFISHQFGGNKKLSDIYDKDLMIKSKVENLSIAEKLAVDEFIDKIKKQRRL